MSTKITVLRSDLERMNQNKKTGLVRATLSGHPVRFNLCKNQRVIAEIKHGAQWYKLPAPYQIDD